MDPDQLQRFQSALVLTDSRSDASKKKTLDQKRARVRKDRDGKRMGPPRRHGAASSRMDTSRSQFAFKETDGGPRPPFSFTEGLLTPASQSKALPDQLPAEILSEIFLRCLPDHFFFQPRPTAAPLLLCQICAYWRQVALATPKLWVIVSVQGHKQYDSSYLSLLRSWMERSSDHPIFLHFGAGTEDFPGVETAFELFLSHSHHWRYLSVSLSDSIAKQLLAYPIPTGCPLTTLRLDASACSNTQATKIAESLNRFPHLCRVQLSKPNAEFLDTRWTQMTHIWLECYVRGNDCVEILAGCLQLEDFRVAHIAIPANSRLSRDIVLSKLFTLQLTSIGHTLHSILDRLICPSLRILKLKINDNIRDVYPGVVQSFVDFFTLSECNLENFSLHQNRLPEHDLITYLQTPAFRSVQYLELECEYLGLETLELFKYPEDANTNILFPSLHTVWLRPSSSEVQSFRNFELPELERVLSSTPLKTVYFCRNRRTIVRKGKVQEGILDMMRALIQMPEPYIP
jgi:F-box-like